MESPLAYATLIDVAREEAAESLAQGGVPIGAAVFSERGELLGRGHNRRIQDDNLFMHAETAAMSDVGRVSGGFGSVTLVTTLAPCWFCSGLIRQFSVPRVVIGNSEHYRGGMDWLEGIGVEIIDLADRGCIDMMSEYMETYPDVLLAGRGEV